MKLPNSALIAHLPSRYLENIRPAAVFTFKIPTDMSKGVLIFSVMPNNLDAAFIVACSWRLYEFEIGAKQYNTWETFYALNDIIKPTNITGFFGYIRMRIFSTNKNQIQVVIREIPEYSSVFCVSSNGLELIEITEED